MSYSAALAAADRCHLSSLLAWPPTRSLPWYLENDGYRGRLLGMTVQRWIESNCSTVGISGLCQFAFWMSRDAVFWEIPPPLSRSVELSSPFANESPAIPTLSS